MIKTHKFKLYSSKRNRFLDEQTRICGNIYNHCVALKKHYYKLSGKTLSKYDLQKHLTKLKRLEKYSFWNKVGSQAIQDITDRIDRAYKAFFSNCKKKTKTRKVSPPSFKSSRSYASMTFKQAGWGVLDDEDVQHGKLKINRKIYKYHKSREIEGDVRTVTVKKDKLGDWYVYFVCDVKNDQKSFSMTGKTAGFDFGCKTFLTSSDGNKIHSPLFLKKRMKKVKQAHRALSSKKKGSKNRRKARAHLSRVQKKIANQRTDWIHKLTNQLVASYDVLIFETLDLQSMARNGHGKKISDLGFSEFMSILEYKCAKHGKVFHRIDKWFASSKTCSQCNHKKDSLHLYDRTWICPECDITHDRDANASINIKNKGVEELEARRILVGASTNSVESVSTGEPQPAFA